MFIHNLYSERFFSKKFHPIVFVSIFAQSYNEHLLKYALQCLVGVSYTSNNDIKSLECNDATVIKDVLNYSELLKESEWHSFIFSFLNFFLFVQLFISSFYLFLLIAEFRIVNFILYFLDCEDPLIRWWTNLFSIDAYWLLGENSLADKLFEEVRKVPKVLRDTEDPLARAAVTVFCAKKLLA